MKPARSKTSSSTSKEADEGKFDEQHNSSPSPSSGKEQPIESSSQKIIRKNSQGFSQTKRSRDESSENIKAKPSKMSKKASGVDLEELLAQTYPKETSHTPAADEEVRRSSRPRYRPVKPLDSAKKWSGSEEICVAQSLLETSSPSGELNMSMFYQRAKEELQKEISNSQLYDKVRSMNRRFRSIQSKMQEQNIAEESFAFRTPQEPALFHLWKQIWGKNNNISANGGQIARDGNLSEAENPKEFKSENKTEDSDDERAAAEESNGDQRQYEEEETQQQKLQQISPQQQNLQEISPQQRNLQKKTPQRRNSQKRTPQQRNLQKKRPHQILAENGNKTTCSEEKDLQNILKNLLESTEQRVESLIQGSVNRLQASLSGGCTSWSLSRRMKELMDAVNSVEDFPEFSAAQAIELQQKWRRHRIQELKTLCEYFGLLHGQCKAFLDNLDN